MLETIRKFIKGVWDKMFNKSTIESKMNVDIAMSNTMSNHIALCKQVHENKAPWINNKTVFSSNTAAGIASEVARLVTLEFKSEISNNNFLNEEYQAVIKNIRNYTQFACATGGLVFKPYVSGKHIEVDFTQADAFYPVSFNSRGEVTAAIFIETKTEGDTTYTRLEYHSMEKMTENGKEIDVCMIRNSAFKKKNYNQVLNTYGDSLGDEIPLNEVEEWSNLQPQTTIKNVDRPLFGYFKIPLANTIDSSSPLGVSIYSSIVEPNGLLQQIDEQYSRILWEYKSKEAAIHVDRDLLKNSSYDNSLYMPIGMERLYRNVDIDSSATGAKQIDVYSPDIRDISLFNGLNELYRQAEFQCGLSYGTLSRVEDTAKTATEIKASKQRMYQNVKDIQKSLETALKDLIYAMNVWSLLAGLDNKVVDLKQVSFNFDDSIITDVDKENDSMFLDVSSGLLKPIYYIMKKYKVTEKEAEGMMADTQDSITGNNLDKNTNPTTGLPN